MATQVSGFFQNASDCLKACTQNVPFDTVENEQEEEIESMQAAEESDKQSYGPGQETATSQDLPATSKRTKLEVMGDSLKTASAQVVVENTLVEYARSACQFANLGGA